MLPFLEDSAAPVNRQPHQVTRTISEYTIRVIQLQPSSAPVIKHEYYSTPKTITRRKHYNISISSPAHIQTNKMYFKDFKGNLSNKGSTRTRFAHSSFIPSKYWKLLIKETSKEMAKFSYQDFVCTHFITFLKMSVRY